MEWNKKIFNRIASFRIRQKSKKIFEIEGSQSETYHLKQIKKEFHEEYKE